MFSRSPDLVFERWTDMSTSLFLFHTLAKLLKAKLCKSNMLIFLINWVAFVYTIASLSVLHEHHFVGLRTSPNDQTLLVKHLFNRFTTSRTLLDKQNLFSNVSAISNTSKTLYACIKQTCSTSNILWRSQTGKHCLCKQISYVWQTLCDLFGGKRALQ